MDIWPIKTGQLAEKKLSQRKRAKLLGAAYQFWINLYLKKNSNMFHLYQAENSKK